MTDGQREVLLALNLRQMQMADNSELSSGVFTSEVASACGRSNRSAASLLSMMREFDWVQSCHGSDMIGWLLVDKGVQALERDRAAASGEQRP